MLKKIYSIKYTKQLKKKRMNIQMINFIKKTIWSLCRKRKINNIIKDSMIKNERILEQLKNR